MGRLEQDGAISPNNGQQEPANDGISEGDTSLVGHIDVYGIGEGLIVPYSESQTGWTLDNPQPPRDEYNFNAKGSSLVAPQIAGLAAYFAGSPAFPVLEEGSVAMERKKQIVALARHDPNHDAKGAAYNGVRDIYCNFPPSSPSSKLQLRAKG